MKVKSNGKYHILLRITHWVMAAIIITMIGIGWYMEGLPKDGSLRNILVGFHKSFGVLVLILFFVRVILRLTTKTPPLPASFPRIERIFAHLGHLGLYVLIFLVPFSGYAMSNLFGFGVKMFGIEMPRILNPDKALAKIAHSTHEILPYILLGLVVVHILAVIKHHFFDKKANDVLKRML